MSLSRLLSGDRPIEQATQYGAVFSLKFPASPDSTATHMSWASKVKKTPRNLTSLSPSSPLTSSQKEQKIQAFRKGQLTPNVKTEAEVEEVIVKKRKKKKNKSSSNNDHQDHERSQNGNVILQEPPKIQDNEEFPDLMSSFGGGGGERRLRFGTSNTPCYSETTKQATESAKTKRGGRKSKVPVQFNLGGMLAALEQKQHTEKAKPSPKPVVLSVGGGIPVLPRETVAVTKHQQTKASSAPHNPLDSSSPMVKKGKQREVPKAKKPTSLKKIILKEREERKQRQTSVILDTMQQSEEVVSDKVECLEEDKPQSEDSLLRIEELIEIPADAPEVDNELLEGPTVATEGPSPGTLQISNLPKIHSRRFREYCSQVLSKEVDSCVTDLLKELVRFQDRLYLKDPVKAKAKRRLVMGLREVSKHLKLRKLKCIIISPNCEKIQSKGGLDEALQTIISCACEQNVPFVFALNRKALGWCVNKAVPVSVVGIFSYDGAQDHFHKLYELTMQARQAYKDMIAALQEQQTENDSGEDKLERSVDKQQRLDEVTTVSAAEENDEPNYIKLWKKMLEEEYIPYALNLEETVAADMLNLQL